MKRILLATVAAVIGSAYMSEVCEVVTIRGQGGKPVRVNKSDYDADQKSDKPTMKLHKDDDNTEQPIVGQPLLNGLPDGVPPTAAPSAPNFNTGGDVGTPDLIDPKKNAVAPTIPSANQYFVAKDGAKFKIVDGAGNAVTNDLLDPAGYDTEGLAWDAVMKLPR